MKHLKSYEKNFNQKVDEIMPTIQLKIDESTSEYEFLNYIDTEFTEVFEDIIWSTTISLVNEGIDIMKWFKSLKDKIKGFLNKIGNALKDSIFSKFISTIKNKIKSIEKDCLLFFDDLKKSVIKNEIILPGNKVNFKKITQIVMGIIRDEKKDIEPEVLKDIETNVGSIQLKESIQSGQMSKKSIESLLILENDMFLEHISDINENLLKKAGKWLKDKYNQVTTTGEEVGDESKVTTKKGKEIIDNKDVITFEVDGATEGKNISRKTIANAAVGIFTKLLLKLGVSSPRAEVALSKLAFLLIPIIITIVIGIFSASGGVSAIGLGGVFLAPAFSIFTVVCGLFFCLGAFLLMCWFRKPYPDLKDYIQYLEAWFEVYPSGRRSEEEIEKGKKRKQFKVNLEGDGKEGFGKFEDKRLKKDTTCTLLGKLNALEKKSKKDDEDSKNIEKVKKFLSERGIEEESYEEERIKCAEKRKSKEEEDKGRKRIVSYKKGDGDYQTGVATGK